MSFFVPTGLELGTNRVPGIRRVSYSRPERMAASHGTLTLIGEQYVAERRRRHAWSES